MRIEKVLERLGPRREEVVIDREFFHCGRMKDRDLVCLSLLVSREHCVFNRLADGLYVMDLGVILIAARECVETINKAYNKLLKFISSNGIFINGDLKRPRKQILLKDNDIIGIGCQETNSNNLEDSMFVYRVKSRVLLGNDCDSTSSKEDKADATNDERNNEERAARKEQSRMRKSDTDNVPNKVPKKIVEICNIIDEDDDDIIEIIECSSSRTPPVVNKNISKPPESTCSGSKNVVVNVADSNSKISIKNQSKINEIMEIDIEPVVPIIKSEPVHLSVNRVSADTTSSVNIKQELQNNVEDYNGPVKVKQEPEFCFSQIDLVEINDDDDEADDFFPASQLFDKTNIKEEQEDCPEAESFIFLDDDDENIITILDSDDENENPSDVMKDIYSNVRIKKEYPELNEAENQPEVHLSYVNIHNADSVISEAILKSTTSTSESKAKSASEYPAVPLLEEPTVDPLIEEPIMNPLIEEPTVDPLAIEHVNQKLINTTLVDPLVTEHVNGTSADPLVTEHVNGTSADPLVAEHVSSKLLNESTASKGNSKERKKGVEIIEPHVIKSKRRRSGKTDKKEKNKSKDKESSSKRKKKLSDLSKSSSSRSNSKSDESSSTKKHHSKDRGKDSKKDDSKSKDSKSCSSPDNSKENESTNEREKTPKNDTNDSNSLQNTTASPEVQKPRPKMTNVKVKVSSRSRGDMLCDSMQTLRPVPRKLVKKSKDEPAKTVKLPDNVPTFVIPRRLIPLSSTSSSSASRANQSPPSPSTSFNKEATSSTVTSTVKPTIVDHRASSAMPNVTPTIVNHKASEIPTVTPTIVDHRVSPSLTENDDRIPSPLLAVEPLVNPLATSVLKSSLNNSPTSTSMNTSKKKVSFKENIAAIREYPIEEGNQMRNIKDGLSLRASRRDGIHRPLEMKLEDFLARIFAWEPIWLEQQGVVKNLPPIVKEEEMKKLPNTFNSFEEYYKRMEVLLLLETWQLLYKEYESGGTRYKQSKALHCTFVRHSIRQMQTPNGLRYSMLAVNTLVTNQDIRLQNHPVFGDMIILEYFAKSDVQKDQGGGVKKVQKLRRAFAYVIEVQQQSSLRYLRANADCQLTKYCPQPDALMTYIVQTRIIDEQTVQFEKIARLRSVLYLRSHLRLIQGLQFVPHSALRDSVLNVDVDDFQLEPVTNEQIYRYELVTQEKLNEKQMEAVMKFTNASIKLEPKIGLLVGPPGTGKSKVIANLVTQILYGEGRYVNSKHIRILVCAPSNTAIDEIVLRLLEIRSAIKDYRFKMVRIGRMESMHEEVKKISVTELAKRDAQKTFAAHQQKNSENTEQRKHKLKKEIDALELLLASNPHNLVYRRDLSDLKSKYFKLTNRRPEEDEMEFFKYQNSAKARIINNADIIACTLSSCYTSQMESIFGTGNNKEKIATCIVDEATQCCEAETLIPLMLGVKSLILVGDPNQLPATVMSTDAKKLGLDRSLFTRAKTALQAQCDHFNVDQKDPVIMLNVQYRMVNAISHWPNKYFYEGKLIDRVNYKLAFPFQPYRVINLDGIQDDVKFSNTSEAVFVGNLINCLMTCSKVSTWDGKITIGVITPYQNQKSVIMNTIKEQTKNVPDNIKHKFITEVNTIDSFQGQERDVIIMSCVRSCGIGFLSDQQRLCVALTRAKFSLIICGNFTTFQRDNTWNDLLRDARSRGVVARLNTKARPIDIKAHVIRLDL